jgi:hypothetical protein
MSRRAPVAQWRQQRFPKPPPQLVSLNIRKTARTFEEDNQRSKPTLRIEDVAAVVVAVIPAQARCAVVGPACRDGCGVKGVHLRPIVGSQRDVQPPPRRLPVGLDEERRSVENLPWRDLQQLAATFCLKELVAVQRRGAEVLLRGRVAALSEGERRVLREALAEPA